MIRSRSQAVLILGLLALHMASHGATGQIPEGYEVVRLTNDAGIHSRPDINNRSEVVWSSAYPPLVSDVYRFGDGLIRQISPDELYDIQPVINNHGVIAWIRGPSWVPPFELILYEEGRIRQIPQAPSTDEMPHINDVGQLVWSHDISGDSTHVEVFFYDGKAVTQITNNGLSNQAPRLNIEGDIIWTRFDFAVPSSWTSTVMVFSNGITTELSGSTDQPTRPDINDAGQVAWGSDERGIELWDSGQVEVLTPIGRAPRINCVGDMTFYRWNDDERQLDSWLYKDGEFSQLPEGEYSSAGITLNDRGEAVWRGFDDFGDSVIFMLRRIAAQGDFNHDCRIDLLDF